MIIQPDIERFDYPLSLNKSQHFFRSLQYNVHCNCQDNTCT